MRNEFQKFSDSEVSKYIEFQDVRIRGSGSDSEMASSEEVCRVPLKQTAAD